MSLNYSHWGSDIFSTLAVATLSIGSDIIDTEIDTGFFYTRRNIQPAVFKALQETDVDLL
jgi:hypothetical protein